MKLTFRYRPKPEYKTQLLKIIEHMRNGFEYYAGRNQARNHFIIYGKRLVILPPQSEEIELEAMATIKESNVQAACALGCVALDLYPAKRTHGDEEDHIDLTETLIEEYPVLLEITDSSTGPTGRLFDQITEMNDKHRLSIEKIIEVLIDLAEQVEEGSQT